MNEFADRPADTIEIKVVGKSGQISLGKRFAGKTLRLERRQDGTVLLTAKNLVMKRRLRLLSAVIVQHV